MQNVTLGKSGIRVKRLGFGGIPIQIILGIRYAVKRFGDAFTRQDWVKTAIEKARNCSACRECRERCPYDLPIPELIAKNLRWLDEKNE